MSNLFVFFQGSSCAYQAGVFPWPWWLVLWCWVASCWCPGWHTSVVTGRYFKLSSSAPCCWCCPTSGKEKTWASAEFCPRGPEFWNGRNMTATHIKNIHGLLSDIYIVQIKHWYWKIYVFSDSRHFPEGNSQQNCHLADSFALTFLVLSKIRLWTQTDLRWSKTTAFFHSVPEEQRGFQSESNLKH